MMVDDAQFGEFNRQVSFMQPIHSRHASTNEQLTTYLTSSAVWAAMQWQAAGSNEALMSSRKTELVRVIFEMHYNADVKPTWRLKFGSQEFAIDSIQESQNRMFMTIEAVSREPWRNEYYASASSGYWTDPFGNYWVAVDRGEAQPTFGNLTWTDDNSNSWTLA
jgi:head-tail adaptor